jgi:two-component system OmpR family response regulator
VSSCSQELTFRGCQADLRSDAGGDQRDVFERVAHRILVVEDDPSIRDLLVRVLACHGFQVSAAATAIDALIQYADATPDIMLVDIMMPDDDGISLVRRIRGLPAGHDLPVIFLTARRDMRTVALAMNVGARRYMTKPFGLKDLIGRIRSELRK